MGGRRASNPQSPTNRGTYFLRQFHINPKPKPEIVAEAQQSQAPGDQCRFDVVDTCSHMQTLGLRVEAGFPWESKDSYIKGFGPKDHTI